MEVDIVTEKSAAFTVLALLVVELVLVVLEVVVWLVSVFTTNVAEAESSAGLPMAVRLYEPTATFATTKEAVKVPLEIEQVHVAIAFPDTEQAVSLDEKSVPET